MKKPDFEIPADRLPEGFAQTVGRTPDAPAPPRPAATIVLVRPGDGAPEVLLLRRNRTVGFVPGAYVFPGGRVDDEDMASVSLDRISGLSVARAAERLGLEPEDVTGLGYYVAALREAFEETGIMVARTSSGALAPDIGEHPEMERALTDLHAGSRGFAELLADLDLVLDGHAVEYIAHWITPEAEPRRYDTRFFAAAVAPKAQARPDGSEITEAVWLTAAAALERNRNGGLPMVFPTIKTLQSFLPFADVESLFESFAGRAIPAITPRLVRTPTGVGIEVPDDPEAPGTADV
jgi:8-oxo-dGTP pyrophosphatase MutT (NUDIX family)